MRNRALRISMTGLVTAAAGAATAYAVALGGEYQGEIRGDPAASLAFDITRTDSGRRRVTNVIASGLNYRCEEGAPDQTPGVELQRGFRIKRDRTFGGHANAVILGFDPPARFRGKVRRNGRVFGTLRLRGELDPVDRPDVECRTGLQEWKAKRVPPLR